MRAENKRVNGANTLQKPKKSQALRMTAIVDFFAASALFPRAPALPAPVEGLDVPAAEKRKKGDATGRAEPFRRPEG